jgi:leucine dehydrogenase
MLNLSLFSHPDFDGHERVLHFFDESSGVKGVIAIHNTFRGPSLGGCRIWPYASAGEALTDALRLSRGMTYKAALANLNLGGGKAVVMADPKKDKSEAFFKAIASAVNDLNGRYITAEDVGTTVKDMVMLKKHTSHVVGLPENLDQDDGDPSPYTSYGIYQGIRASVMHRFQTDQVDGLTVAVQGLGKVGSHLCHLLHEGGAKLIVTDIDEARVQQVVKEFEAQAVAPDEIYGVQADVLSPCALGGVVNDTTLDQFKVAIIAGGANNQLFLPRHAQALEDRGITYAPDYAISAGGLIRVTYDGKDFLKQDVIDHVGAIYNTMLEVYRTAADEGLLPNQAADRIAEKRFGKVAG